MGGGGALGTPNLYYIIYGRPLHKINSKTDSPTHKKVAGYESIWKRFFLHAGPVLQGANLIRLCVAFDQVWHRRKKTKEAVSISVFVSFCLQPCVSESLCLRLWVSNSMSVFLCVSVPVCLCLWVVFDQISHRGCSFHLCVSVSASAAHSPPSELWLRLVGDDLTNWPFTGDIMP